MRRLAERLGGRGGDIALAAALVAIVQFDTWSSDGYRTGSRPVLAIFGVLMTAPLAVRRRMPAAAAIAIAGALVLQVALEPTPHPPDTPFLVWIVAAYSVAAHAPLRRSLIGGVAVVAAVDAWASLTPEDSAGDLVFLSLILGGFWLAGRLVRSRNVLAGTLRERTKELELEREERARLAVAQERTRIARELHDIVSHTLSVIVVQAGAERVVLPPDAPSREALGSIEYAGRQALREMGRLLGMLRASEQEVDLAPQPGLERLDELLAGVRQTGLDVELVANGTPRVLAPGMDLSAYRIVQEALTNVIKHGGARRARVVLRWEPSALAIEVADDGVGPAQATGTGHGLLGLRERVALFDGVLATGRSDLGGYLLTARLPLQPA